MTDKLTPVRCGCGGEAEIVKSRLGSWFIYCDKCKMCSGYYDTEAEAITAWNRAMGAKDINVPNKERTAKVEEVEKPNVFKCSECGQYFHSTAWGSPVEYCSRCGARLIWGEDDE